MKKVYIYIASVFVAFSSCKENKKTEPVANDGIVVTNEAPMSAESKAEAEMEKTDSAIKAYVAANKLDTSMTPTGLVYKILKSNSKGKAIHFTDKVKVKYKGTLLDGTPFDQGEFEFEVGAHAVIPGWDEGIELMKEGEKMLLIVPFWQGYGDIGSGPIPPYGTMVFEMEALQVTPSQK